MGAKNVNDFGQALNVFGVARPFKNSLYQSNCQIWLLNEISFEIICEDSLD